MQKRTIVTKMQDKLQKELQQAALELVVGGIKTMTNKNGPVEIIEDAPPPV